MPNIKTHPRQPLLLSKAWYILTSAIVAIKHRDSISHTGRSCALGTTGLVIRIYEQIRAIIPQTVIKVLKGHQRICAILRLSWPFPKGQSPTVIGLNVNHDTTQALCNGDRSTERGLSVYAMEKNPEGQLYMPLHSALFQKMRMAFNTRLLWMHFVIDFLGLSSLWNSWLWFFSL